MSFEDIEAAQAMRAAKEKGKGQYSQKHKSGVLEADESELEPEPKLAQIIKVPES